jgi:hypothetical protein
MHKPQKLSEISSRINNNLALELAIGHSSRCKHMLIQRLSKPQKFSKTMIFQEKKKKKKIECDIQILATFGSSS